ncbi:TPA: iron ABC transporter permease [Salmonella enterica]|nr:iron ABC transporter permease [Salmonella enterica]
MQSITHNALADPGLFGVSQGAMTMIVVLLVFFPAAPKVFVALAGLAGGLMVALLLLLLVGRRYTGGLALLLLGLAVSSVLGSVSMYLLLYLPTELSLNLAAWMEGSLFQANWWLIAHFSPLLLLSLVGIAIAGPALKRYQVGSELAMSLGEPVNYSRPLLMTFSVLLSAASVTAVGPFAFLGILAPHIANFLSAPAGRARLFLSGMVGGTLVIAADIITKTGPAGFFLPIGLSFTLIGVPMFVLTIWLRAMHRR